MSTEQYTQESKGVEGKAEDATSLKRLTFRSIIIGVLVVIFLGTVNFTWQQLGIRHSFDTLFPVSIPGITVLVLMMFANILIKRLKGKSFQQSELVSVYTIIWAGGITLSIGGWFGFYMPLMPLYPLLSYAMNARRWGFLYEQVSEWLFIKDMELIEPVFLGLRDFSISTIPWNAWIIPILMWTLLYAAVFWTAICLGTFIRKHWSMRQLAVYPLTKPVVEVVSTEQDEEGRRGFKSKLFWLGFGLMILFMIWGQIARYTGVSTIPRYVYLFDFLQNNPWNVLSIYPTFAIGGYHPAVVAVAYMAPLDVLFSTWFFYIVSKLWIVFAEVVGLYSQSRAFGSYSHYYLTTGGALVYAVLLIWLARYDLKRMFKTAFGMLNEDPEDKFEPLSPRAAVFGFIISGLLCIFFLTLILGMSLHVALVTYMSFVVALIVFARLRAESGVPMSDSGLAVDPLILVGSNRMTKADAYSEIYILPYTYLAGVSYTAMYLEACTLADESRLNRRDLWKTFTIGFSIAILLGMFVTIFLVYKHGAPMAGHESSVNLYTLAESYTYSNEYEGTWQTGVMTILGGLVMLFLGVMRNLYVWWPLHPVGFILGSVDTALDLWVGVFIAWFLKLLIYRYGGVALNKKLTPFFMGIFIGYVLYSAIGTIVGLPQVWPL